MKNRKAPSVILFALSLLFSCQSKAGACYQCFYGNMEVSSVKLPYETIRQKPLQKNFTDKATENTVYYADIFVLNEQQDVDDFFKVSGLSVDPKEYETRKTLPEGAMDLYVIAQIPEGYQAYKRYNKQHTDTSGATVLWTENFFYYVSRPEISYCEIDIRKDSTVLSPSVFTLYYRLPSSDSSQLTSSSIRPILTDSYASEANETETSSSETSSATSSVSSGN
jgi:hypothetical protein